MKNQEYFVTETVAPGHPDKIADQIAEAILDTVTELDPVAKLACEVLVGAKKIIIIGEYKSDKINFSEKNFEQQIKDLTLLIIKNDIGYTEMSWKGLKELKIEISMVAQSKEINEKVESKKNVVGAGDNSTSYGWAEKSEATHHYPPLQFLAREIILKISDHGKSKENKFNFAPDGKIQIYAQNGMPVRVVLCKQFLSFDIQNKQKIKNEIIMPICQKFFPEIKKLEFELISFINGGPDADTGLTGRKLLIDNYGTFAKVGGGSFAGKDISKTDKSLALFARYLAKNIIFAGFANTVEIQISAYIGQTDPFYYDLKLDSNKNYEAAIKLISPFLKLTLSQIFELLDLKNIKFQTFAKSGYFGFSGEKANWESRIKNKN